MSRKICIMLFFVVILVGSYIPLLEATTLEEGVRYFITINNTEGFITVEAHFPDVDEPQITFILPAANYFESRGVPITVTLLETDGSVLERDKYGWTLRPRGGLCISKVQN